MGLWMASTDDYWLNCLHPPTWKTMEWSRISNRSKPLPCWVASAANDPRFDSCARKKVVQRPLGAVRLSGCGIEVILVGRVWRTLGAFREYPWTSQFLLNYLKIIRSSHVLMISAMKSWSQFNDAQALSRCIHGFVWKLGSRKSQFQWGKVMIDHQILGYHIFRQPPHGSCNL
jgi:hypothetical protein